MAVDGYLNFDTKINTSGFTKGIKIIGNAARDVTSSIMSMTDRVIAGFSKITAAYQTQIEAETRFETTIRNSASATNEQIQSVKDLASSLQALGIVGDEVQLAGAQELSTYVSSVESVKKMLPVLNDMIAQQYGFSASTDSAVTIATMLGKVLQGQTSALSRYGYSFDEAQEQLLKYGTEQQRVATLAAVVEESVAGVNEALANTPTGKVKQLSNDFGDLKETMGKLLTDIAYPLVVRLDVIVKKLNEVFSTAITGIKSLLGISDDFSFGATVSDVENSAEDTAESFADIADEAERAEKANRKNLAVFDELNVLSQNENTAATVLDTENLKDNTEPVELPVELEKTSFEKAVDGIAENLKEKWNRFLVLITPIEEAFERLRKTLDKIKKFAGDNLINFYDLFLKPLGKWTLGKAFPKFIDIVNSTLHVIDWKKINMSLADLYSTLEPFTENVGMGLLWFTENILEPLAEWTIGEAFPTFITVLSGFLELVDKVGDIVGRTLKDMWDNFFSKIVDFAGDTIIGLFTVLGQLFKDIANNPDAVTSLVVIAEVIGTIAAALIFIPKALALAPAVMHGIKLMKALFSGLPVVIASVANPVGLILTALIAIGVVIVEIITYKDDLVEFGHMVFDYYSEKISDIWKKLKDGAKSAWGSVKSVFSTVGEFFGDVFSRAWQKVKDVFSAGGMIFTGIKDSIFTAFKNVVNSLIDGINTVIAIPFNNINWVLGNVRDVEIAGFQPFGWVPTIDIPEIPHLAQGKVIPANYGEFAAILGDNKRETEVVSPVSEIERAVENVLERRGISSNQSGDIVIQIDGREIFRATKKQAEHWSRMHGGRPAFGGT